MLSRPANRAQRRPGRRSRGFVAGAVVLVAIVVAMPAGAAGGRQAFVPPTLYRDAAANPNASFDVIVQGVPGKRSADVAAEVRSQRAANPGRATGIKRSFVSISG